MKYIIDLSDEYVMEYALYGKQLSIPFYVNANDKSFYLPTGLKVEPYTEPDRKVIEDEVWELASKLIWTFTERECKQIFGMESVYVPRDMLYSEAKSKYEAWKKQREDEATMKEVTTLAEKIGIHKLYSMVKEIRGE